MGKTYRKIDKKVKDRLKSVRKNKQSKRSTEVDRPQQEKKL